MEHIGDEQRRARLATRHALITPVDRTLEAIRSVVCLHSSDPASVYLSAWARTIRFEVTDLDELLYRSRELVRLLGMRRTLWVAPVELAAAIQAVHGPKVAATERKKLEKWLVDQPDGPVELDVDELIDTACEYLAEHGPTAGRILNQAIPGFADTIAVNPGSKWSINAAVGSRITLLASIAGRLVRGPSSGSWIASQYAWADAASWFGATIDLPDARAARTAIAGEYLRAFGPASRDDVKWWTGWNLGETRTALADIGAVEVTTDSGSGWVLPDDLEPMTPVEPWVALLPGLDPTTMGWKDRSFYLSKPIVAEVFDRNGNAGPTIWCDGRVVGSWCQRRDTGEIATELLVDVGSEATELISAKAAELQSWLGPVVVKPRFPTPADRRLSR